MINLEEIQIIYERLDNIEKLQNDLIKENKELKQIIKKMYNYHVSKKKQSL